MNFYKELDKIKSEIKTPREQVLVDRTLNVYTDFLEQLINQIQKYEEKQK